MKFIWIMLSVLSFNTAEAARIIQVSTGAEITEFQFFGELQLVQNIILGEKHYTPAVQLGEAAVIQGVVGDSHRAFTLGWEFLNVSARTQITQEYKAFLTGRMSALELLNANLSGTADNQAYVPVFETLKSLGGSLIPLNLSRAEKAPVVQAGITAADPILVPPGFELGDVNYYERFVATMEGHADSTQMANYFAAQCLVDDVMAYHLLTDAETELRFMIAGSFHTDYHSGTVARLRARAPGLKTMVVRITDTLDPADSKYGEIADYIYLVNAD